MLKIVSDPKRISLESYDAELHRYIERASKHPSIKSICTFGSIGAPGLSDLDVLCVLEDDFDKSHNNLLRTLGKDFNKNIFIHGPILISENHLNDLNYLIYAPKLEVVYGDGIKPKDFKPSDQHLEHLVILYLIDFSQSRLIQYAQARKMNLLDKRKWITRIWSLTHSEKMCSIVGISLSNDSQSVLAEVLKLRKDWNNGIDVSNDLIEHLFIQSEKIIKEIIVKALDKESKYFNPKQILEGDFIFTNRKMRIKSSKQISNPHSEAHFGFKWKGRGKYFYTTYMPLSYTRHLNIYGFRSNREKIKFECNEENYVNAMRKRRSVVELHTDWLISNKLSFSMKGYLGMPVHTVNNFTNKIDAYLWSIYQQFNQ